MTVLEVHMEGRLAGVLDATDRRSLRFSYEPAYVEDRSATPLSVSMPLRRTAYGHAAVHPYLMGLLPDDERVVARWAREFGCSPNDVAGLLRGVGADVARFLGALVFPWLVVATDGHAKNLSFLLSGHQVRLAPMCDVASALPHLAHVRRAKLAHKIGGEYRPLAIQWRHWERLARPRGLSSDESRARIGELVERLPDAFTDAVATSGLADVDRRAASAFRDQIVSWIEGRRGAVLG